MIKVREYVDKTGKSPYAVWHDRLDAMAATKVSTVLYRLEQGNFSNTKGIGRRDTGKIIKHVNAKVSEGL